MEENNNIIKEQATTPDIPKEIRNLLIKAGKNTSLSKQERLHMLSLNLNTTEEDVQNMLDQCNIQLNETMFSKAKFHTIKESKRYLISSAQNGSPVHIEFLRNMEAYASFIDAEIGIIATRYKNPTSLFIDADVWASEVQPYLTANKQVLHKNLQLLGGLKVQATSPNPTNGIEVFGTSVIVGAPRIEMRTVPVLPNQEQIFLYSTGSTTIPNFTDTVAGGKAAAHHSYGFIVVEIESDEVVHLRSVVGNSDGSFNDLCFRVENQTVEIEKVDTLVWGDSHFAKKDQKVTNAFRKLSVDLSVDNAVLHDVWDSQSLNIHNETDPIIRHQLMKEDKDDLRKELEQMYSELDWFEKNMKQTLIISSNHDDMLDRAMKFGDWRNNLKNAEIFIEMLQLSLSQKAVDGIIPYYINSKYKNIKALGLNDSYIKFEVELALHGHKGPNGARGNIQAFSKLANKTIIGHSHSPAIKWGCYQVGVSCKLDHGYNQGLSGWAYAGVTLNEHGKRQMIVFNKKTLTYTTLY